MRICPCKNCQERWAKCRIGCDKYKDWRKEYDDLKEKADKEKQLDNSLTSYVTEAKHRIYKHCNYKKK